MSTLFILQDICNGIGTCGCDGTCDCPDLPYFGDFCELCSGDDICSESNCDSNRDCANCILDIIIPLMNTITVEDFANKFVASQLPDGYVLMRDDVNDVNQITLPTSACPVCESGAIIISETDTTSYRIEGMNIQNLSYGFTSMGKCHTIVRNENTSSLY